MIGPEALNHYVGILNHAVEHLQGRWILQIQGNAFLVAPHGGEVVAQPVRDGLLMATEVSHTRVLDLDDLRTEVGEQLRCVSSRKVAGQVEDPQLFHSLLLILDLVPCWPKAARPIACLIACILAMAMGQKRSAAIGIRESRKQNSMIGNAASGVEASIRQHFHQVMIMISGGFPC